MMTFVRAQTWATAIATAVLLGGCAGLGHGMHGMHGMHGAGPGGGCPMHADTQQEMAAATTPEERQALMAEHYKSMGMAGGMQCPMALPPAK